MRNYSQAFDSSLLLWFYGSCADIREMYSAPLEENDYVHTASNIFVCILLIHILLHKYLSFFIIYIHIHTRGLVKLTQVFIKSTHLSYPLLKNSPLLNPNWSKTNEKFVGFSTNDDGDGSIQSILGSI